MAKILKLDPHVADLIAAGEVVERPASVIKELMENSIDAGATVMTVEIQGGGMTYIRVTDNGGGIAPEDAETAFLRHATSKLRDQRGLEAIGTLGFRGEALAAIASVSRVELMTREQGADAGVSLTLEGGVVTDRAPAGCPQGTTMIVRDLFYNTPARLKFMKTDRAEGASCSAAVLRCALAHPEISVRYIKDGKEECHTPGDGRMDSCIYSLFGREFAAGLIGTSTEADGVRVKGYVCAPRAARGNRSYQFFIVNGRNVRSKALQAALEQAYKNSLFTGRFPSCVLYITLSPAAVDVNVHPTKTEVKFLYEKQVFDGVYYAALNALQHETGSAEVAISTGTKKAVAAPAPEKPQGAGFTKMSAEEYRKSPGPAAGPPARDLKKPTFYGAAGKNLFREARTSDTVRDSGGALYRAAPAPKREEPKEEPPEQTSLAGMPEAESWRLIGEAMDTYIIVEKGTSLWLIDKHAAHERIHFDRLKASGGETMTQTLLAPIVCRTGREDTAVILDNAELLSRFGLAAEPFGEDAVALREIPADLMPADAEAALYEICELLKKGGGDDPSRADGIMHTMACKAAVKAGMKTDPAELRALVQKVMSGEVRYCPHGRPVAVELTKSALDKSFKRI